MLNDGHAVGVVGQDELVMAYGRPDRDGLTAEDVMNETIPRVRPDIRWLPLRRSCRIWACECSS